MAKPKVFPALLAATESDLATRVALIRSWNTPVHLDIVDGRFARPRSASGSAIGPLPRGSEVHLMVQQPLQWKADLLRWKPSTVILHVESQGVRPMMTWLTKQGITIRVALKTSTPVSALAPFLNRISGVHVMMGPIGSYGSALEPDMWLRVKYFAEAMPRKIVSVDVGITRTTWKTAQRYGATVASVGSYIFQSRQPKARWKSFLR